MGRAAGVSSQEHDHTHRVTLFWFALLKKLLGHNEDEGNIMKVGLILE